jgi:hypothetical protein
MIRKKYEIYIKIIIILLPIILSLYVFSPFEEVEITKEHIDENTTILRISDEVFEPTTKNLLRDALQIPLNLRWYDICFVNKDTKNVYTDRRDYNVNVTLYFNDNQTILEIPTGETKCIPYQFNKEFTYNWGFGTMLRIYSSDLKPKCNAEGWCYHQMMWRLHTDVDSYARPEFKSVFISNIIAITSLWGAILIFASVFKFIKE